MIARSEWASTDPNPAGYTAHSQSGHALRFDASKEHAEGPSPMEVVLMALCGCTSVDVVNILRKKRQPLAALTVSAVAEQAATPPNFFNKIQLIYKVTAEPGGTLEPKAVEDAVMLSKDKYCSVSAMLETKAAIEFVIEYEDGRENLSDELTSLSEKPDSKADGLGLDDDSIRSETSVVPGGDQGR